MQIAESHPFDPRLGDRMLGGLIYDGRMVGRVVFLQGFGQHSQAAQVILASEIELADQTDLPENERAARIEAPPVNQKIGRLEALTAGRRRIDTKVGEKTVFRR